MSSIDLIVPSIVGAGVGILFSFLFVRYSSVNNYKATIFGVSSDSLITSVMLFLVVGGIGSLAGMAAVIKDTAYITNDPFKFTIETLVMGLLPTLALIIVIYFRKKKYTSTNNIESLILFAKFSLLHVLLQISGYYRYVFSS